MGFLIANVEAFFGYLIKLHINLTQYIRYYKYKYVSTSFGIIKSLDKDEKLARKSPQ